MRALRKVGSAAREVFTDPVLIARYMAMGALSAVINFGTFLVVYEILGVWYMVAAVLAFFARLVFKFLISRVWLFKSRAPGTSKKHFLQFFLMEAGFLTLSLILLAGLVELLGVPPFAALILVAAVLYSGALVVTRLIFGPRKGREAI